MHDDSQRSLKNHVPLHVVLAALVLIGVAGGGAWLTLRYIAWLQFKVETQRIETIVEGWRVPPPHADPDCWEAAWQTVYNAVGNVCFSPKHVSAEELARLRADVESVDRQPVTFDTLAWLWSRLGQTGPHGNEYITRLQPMWQEAEEWMRKGSDK